MGAHAQYTTSDYRFIGELKKQQQRKTAYTTTFSGALNLYKTYISSQDVPNVCKFQPSCSVYGHQALHKNGVFIGIMLTLDRLTRCNGRQTTEIYDFDENTQTYIDFPD